MIYTIQVLAGVAVALSAVLGVVWRRARRWLLRAMHVDENAGKAVEPAAHAVDANDAEAHTAADAATRKLTEPRKPFAPALSWRARLVLALIAALCVYRLLQEVVLNGNLPAADGTPVDWTIYDKINLKSALAWFAVVAAFIALARLRPLASRVASVAACLLIVIAQSVGLGMLGAQYADTLARPVVPRKASPPSRQEQRHRVQPRHVRHKALFISPKRGLKNSTRAKSLGAAIRTKQSNCSITTLTPPWPP